VIEQVFHSHTLAHLYAVELRVSGVRREGLEPQSDVVLPEEIDQQGPDVLLVHRYTPAEMKMIGIKSV